MQEKLPARGPRTEEVEPLRAERAIVAYAETGSFRKAAAETGLSDKTVKAILDRNPEDFTRVKKVLAAKFFIKADSALNGIDENDLQNCTGPQKAIIAGICTQRGSELVESLPPADQFDPQIARHLLEESQFWREELQRRGETPIETEEEYNNAVRQREAESAPSENQTAGAQQGLEQP